MTCDVVIPCFNAARYIREAIASALAQTRPPAKVIVVDDGSTDESFEVASSFGPPVQVVRQQNAGECAARNTGLSHATSEWAAFLDADDIWQPAKLARQLDAVSQRPDVVCVHCDYYLFGAASAGEPILPELPADGCYPVERLLIDPLIHPSSAMVRRDVTERFPVGVRQGGDMLFFAALSLAPGVRFAHVPEALVGYRLHPAQVTREQDAWVTHLQNRFRWIDASERSLGAARSGDLRCRLRAQAIEWIHLARWTRQWLRYRQLQKYAATLDWPEGRPAVLGERLLPAVCYTVKDWIDQKLGGTMPSVRTHPGARPS